MIKHLVIILAANAAFCVTRLNACNPTDVIFVVDSSDNVGTKNFGQELQYIKRVVQKLNVSPAGTHVGVVTFGTQVHGDVFLNQHLDPTSLSHATDALHFKGGVTHTADAIKYAYQTSFSPLHGGRPDVPHIVVLLTNGPSSTKDLTLLQAQTAKDNDIMIYSIGIGNALNHDELIKVASSPSSRYVLSATNFDSLETLSGLMAARICDEEQLDAAMLPSPSSSINKADITFLVDSSSSVGSENYEKISGFLKNTIKQLNVGANNVHVGMIQYSGHPSVAFPLDMYYSRPDLFQAVDGTTLNGGGTNTADALTYMSQQVYSPDSGARQQVPRIAVVITDGGTVDEAALTLAADKARQNGIGLIAIGVGPHVDMNHLNIISNDPNSVYTFHVNSYEDLKGLTSRILSSASQIHFTASSTQTHGNLTVCSDKINNCKDYGADVCDNYKQWSEDNCKMYCNLCPSVQTTTTVCADKLANCPNYGLVACKEYAPWAHDNCKQFCGFCSASAQSNGFYGQCFYKNKAYKHGERWTDKCDYECMCEDGPTGKYRCYNRCPVYYNLPPECTLVKSDECCLKPVCNFNQQITEFLGSGHGITTSGINVCVNNGKQYYQGQQWQNGCDSQCRCTDAVTGSYKCHSLCPTYGSIPSMCRMVKEPGQCCSKPVCEFNTQHGSFIGMGSISGNGIGTHPTASPMCVDKINNCQNYDHSVCTSNEYRPWALDNCRKTCDLCTHGVAVSGPNDKCVHNGSQYSQGQSWQMSCHTICICENAMFGYYRCVNRCPKYNNLPAGCYERMQPGECCHTVQCDSGKFISSTTNLNSLGNGGGIYMTGPGGQIIIPTLSSGGFAALGSGGTGYQASAINGCLYMGRLFVQGQQWDEGCKLSCVCKDASTGLYSCRSRCPLYPYLPTGCSLLRDPNDPCCKIPDCTGVASSSLTAHALMPVYQTSSTANGVVKPPNINTLYGNSSWQMLYTLTHHGSIGVGPTSGSHGSGGIGYCYYKGNTYLQDVTWEDGCLYNCICQDASIGKYKCIDKCYHYVNVPSPCYLIPDTEHPCCHVPFCPFLEVSSAFTGLGSTTTPTTTTTTPSTPRPEVCIYKDGTHYSQGQIWFDGCNYKCSCDDSKTGVYRCVTRCPIYQNVPKDCTLQPDSRDPGCCTIPVCPNTSAWYNQTTGSFNIPTGVQGSFTGTGKHPNIGHCEYKGIQYSQSSQWSDGCEYRCRCEDEMSGSYRCTEICPHWPNLPPQCKLITDFANPCCLKPDCAFIPSTGSNMGHGVTGGPATQSPIPKYCIYKSVNYLQGQSWSDGCNLNCRCENSQTGLYTCNQRCASYPNLPSQCKLVANSRDPCCRVANCNFTGIHETVTGSGNVPYMIPTAVPGKITGQAHTPTPTPGPDGKIPTVVPINYCEYKGIQYQQGQLWSDGCAYTCTCLDSNTGRYQCTEKCPRYPQVPPQCRLVRDPANPCCEIPDCYPSVNHGSGSSPTLGPGEIPTTGQTPQLSRNVCVYKGHRYTQSQEWFDGCDYRCVCERADAGVYSCNNRCIKYPPMPPGCSLIPDKTDPFCCKTPKCTFVPRGNDTTVFIPTVPTGIITGGIATPIPTPHPKPGMSTLAPNLTPVPVPKNVCMYKGSIYQQGEKWSDGCIYNCECVSAKHGQYRCSQMCQKIADEHLIGCRLVRDPNNLCCMIPYCPVPVTGYATTPTLSPGLTPKPKDVCLYNGVPFIQGQSWNDGCDFTCTCENATTGSYRCNQRCPEYRNVPSNCQMITNPQNKCCRIPSCTPMIPQTGHSDGPTQIPLPVPTGIPGVIHGVGVRPNKSTNDSTLACVYKGISYTQGQRFQDGCSYSCVCEDSITGRYACTDRCTHYFNVPSYCTMVVDPDHPCCKKPFCQPPITVAPIPGQPNATTPATGQHLIPKPRDVCIYKGKTYMTGQKFYDGCDKSCFCENGVTGFYRCNSRCATYPPLPKNCRLVPDPNDAQCCQKPQCLPVPGHNQTPLPTDHSYIYTNVPGVITGYGLPPTLAPFSTPTLGPHGETEPTHASPKPRHVCVYNGKQYYTGEKWVDGCTYKCECVDDLTGQYRCEDRCPSFPGLPPQCKLIRDQKDFCCYQVSCNWNIQIPVPNPFLTTTPGPSLTTASGPYLIPQPNARCVYKGAAYYQNQVWSEGCTTKCRCDNADKNIYTCFDRCPTYIPKTGCRMIIDPHDSCCQVQVCEVVPTNISPHNTTGIPSPVPTGVTGVIVGTPPTIKPLTGRIGFCAYKNVHYVIGEHWNDGCDYRCECIDDITGKYKCTERCPRFPQLPSYCTLVQDPHDTCCEKPYCSSLTPTLPGQSTTSHSPYQTPSTRHVCVYKNRAYTTGQQFFDGCNKKCVCDDAVTGAMHCTDRCRTYQPQPDCVMVPDSRDPLCCQIPKCPTPGVIGSITGHNTPPTYETTTKGPQGDYNTPAIVIPVTYPNLIPQQKACVYKNNYYIQGQKWLDGCLYNCECVNATTGTYKCTDRCKTFPQLSPNCHLAYDPVNPCCKKAVCPSSGHLTPPALHTIQPGFTPTTGSTPVSGHTNPISTSTSQLNPSIEFCVYHGVPFKHGQTLNDGCDQICRCENPQMNTINCYDRCASQQQPLQQGCVFTTDPQDQCCQIPKCPVSNTDHPNSTYLVPVQPGVIIGSSKQPNSMNPLVVGQRDVCIYHGKAYHQDQTWEDGCAYDCRCIDSSQGKYRCQEKCYRYPFLPSYCTMVQDPAKPCCKTPYCPAVPTTARPGNPTVSPGSHVTTGPSQTPPLIPVPSQRNLCVYKGNYYVQSQQWYDGCNSICKCENASVNAYRCQQRCVQYGNNDPACTIVPDPADPSCCVIQSCPIPTPVPGLTPKPGFVSPLVPYKPAYITGYGQVPSTSQGSITSTRNGCLYKGLIYNKGQRWDDGCQYTCECLDVTTGLYRCSLKCHLYTNLPSRCILLKDPDKPCCQKPYCDFLHSTPFPNGVPTIDSNVPTSGTGGSGTTASSNVPQGFCVYMGSYYTQGQVWSDGCSKTCRCEDVYSGYYTCNERCRTFNNLPVSCTLKVDPDDSCCLVPDCNKYVTPSHNTSVTPGGSATLHPIIVVPTYVPGTITGMGGTNPGGNPGTGYHPSFSGHRSMCVYMGKTYSQNQHWDDGCDYRCECIDGMRGQYRCTERCPRYYYLPPQCHMKSDPKDSCCKIADCTPTPAPTKSTTPTTVTTASTTSTTTTTKAPDVCVYNGISHHQGSTWNDGCNYICSCDDAVNNKFTCNERCTIFSSLPSFCNLIPDPNDPCCETPNCTLTNGQVITPLIPGIGPAISGTLSPSVQHVLPIGTHSVITGSNLPPGNHHFELTGGSPACIYKGKIHRQGDSWEEGCDYTCKCINAVAGEYRCVSKCPKYPPLPKDCSYATVPAQCCKTLSCSIPGYGYYNPVPELLPIAAPTIGPDGQTLKPNYQTNPQLVFSGTNQAIGGSGLSGGGHAVPTGISITGIRDKCIYDQKMYNQGEKWNVGCKYSCECMDARSGYYVCKPKCATFLNLPNECSMVSLPDTCCPVPMCKYPNGTMMNALTTTDSIYPVVGSFTGGTSGFRPGYSYTSSTTGHRNVCIYKGVIYNQGAKWEDGCNFKCECMNAVVGMYQCQPKCPTYTSLPKMCQLIATQGKCCSEISCSSSHIPIHSTESTVHNQTECKDADANCAAYGQSSCKAPYLEWARQHCAAYCNFCSHTVTHKACVDKLPNCAQYDASACTGIYESWARENCNKTCHLCPGDTGTITPPTTTHIVQVGSCKDKLPNCENYGKSACQEPYIQWARDNCAAYCDLCNNTVIVGGNSSVIIGNNPGWLILMKGVAGVPGDLYTLWSSSKTENENINQAKDLTDNYKGHYKPVLTNYWNQLCLDKIKVSIYNKGVEKLNIIFNATGADKMNWFTPERIIFSTYNDIKTAQHAVFTMEGDPNFGREFYISNKESQCDDAYGWIMISTNQKCFYEMGINKPAFLYAPGSSKAHWGFTNPGSGDVFAIQGQGTCNTIAVTKPSIIGGTVGCFYNSKLYQQNDTWIDGCKYNCTCENAKTGTYRCTDLCPIYQNLPAGCTLVKPPGECCAKPNCPSTGGCYYNGHTYAEGEKWDDGCKYKCECQTGSTGRYLCQQKCLTWHLPPECHMDPPPAGKCCEVPVCPQGITIQYPDGYIQE